MCRPIRLVLAAAIALGGCSPAGCAGRAVLPDVGAGRALSSVERVVLDTAGASGLSDLARDDRGRIHAVAERTRVLLPIAGTAPAVAGAPQPVPIDGVPDGMDTESLAFLAGGRLAMGTETQGRDRAEDAILIATIESGRARVTSQITFSYAPWAMRGSSNHGVEALCVAGDRLVVASETVKTVQGRRYAPVAVLNSDGTGPRAFLLRLSSATGAISAIACRAPSAAGIEVLAIERHYGVGRILEFTIPEGAAAGEPPEITPKLLVDLAQHIQPLLNFEGIALDDDGSILLLNDNDTGGVRGATELVKLRFPAAPAP